MVSIIKAINCEVNALVDATPISGPAFVMIAKSDSRTKDEPGTLQIDRLAVNPISLALRRAAKVSAVSPD